MPRAEELVRQKCIAEQEEFERYLCNADGDNGTREMYAQIHICEAIDELEEGFNFIKERTDMKLADADMLHAELDRLEYMLTNFREFLPVCESRTRFLRPQLTRNPETVLLSSVWEIPGEHHVIPLATLEETVAAYADAHAPVHRSNFTTEHWKTGCPMITADSYGLRFRHFHRWLQKTKRGRNLKQGQLRDMLEKAGWAETLLTVKIGKAYKQIYFWFKPAS